MHRLPIPRPATFPAGAPKRCLSLLVQPRRRTTPPNLPSPQGALTASSSSTIQATSALSPRRPSTSLAPHPPSTTNPPIARRFLATTPAMSSAWVSASFINDSRALPLPETDIAHFRTIPALQRWLEDKDYSAVASPTRIARTDGENDLFAITLKTLKTIPRWLLVVCDERVQSLPVDAGDEGMLPPQGQQEGSAGRPDMLLLLRLDQGVNGFGGVAHGGLLCALLDESLSYCVEFARQARTKGRNGLFTANLNVDFRRPVVTPGVAVVKCWTTKVEGRKYWLEGQIEDVDGMVCVQAKGLWIEARSQSL